MNSKLEVRLKKLLQKMCNSCLISILISPYFKIKILHELANREKLVRSIQASGQVKRRRRLRKKKATKIPKSPHLPVKKNESD